jgi:hypothetical protein
VHVPPFAIRLAGVGQHADFVVALVLHDHDCDVVVVRDDVGDRGARGSERSGARERKRKRAAERGSRASLAPRIAGRNGGERRRA